MNFHNLELRVIKPALHRAKGFKQDAKGNWVKDDSTGFKFHGWHGFRRGLGANLLTLGVHPKLIQAILRHSDITTTLELYTQVPDNETREALEKLEAKFNAPGLVMSNSGQQDGSQQP